MPTKDGLILCGCLLDNATHKQFEKICKDMGTTTQELITAFVYSVINGDMKRKMRESEILLVYLYRWLFCLRKRFFKTGIKS